MSSLPGTILKKALSMAGATFASRILGFVREVLMAAILGGGSLASAWTIAFKIPNLFRRVFGEGLLGTVLVPLIAGTLEKEGAECARQRFSTVFIYVAMLLSICSVTVSAAAMIIGNYVSQEHQRLACELIPLLMPYCIFICLIGIMTSVLNAAKVFFLPTLLSLLLNICMIAALLLLMYPLFGPLPMLSTLGVAVLISGILEGILMLLLMKRHGLMPTWNKLFLHNTKLLKEIWKLALPGLLGALAYQINVLTDTLLASEISPHAASALSYSERLVYLPIGVFAVSFGAVSLSEMSHIAERKEYGEMTNMLFGSLRSLLFVTLPLTVYMFFCAEEVIRAVYCRGAFGEQDVMEALQALQFYVLGIPFFAMLKVVLTAFYARKDMKTPMQISACCVVLNLILNLCLMYPLRQGGLALATAIGSLVQNTILLYILNRQVCPVPWKSFLRYNIALAGISLVCMVITMQIFERITVPCPAGLEKYVIPALKGILFFGFYFLTSILFRVEEASALFRRIHKRRRS